MIGIELQKQLDAPNGSMKMNLSFSLKSGDLVTLYGNSGAGKTSILRMIAGLMHPDTGRIKVGENIWYDSTQGIHLKPQRRRVGFVFQDYALFPNMSVRENLLYALEKDDDKRVVDHLVELMELGDLQSRKPETLSGGQKQRVALARSLVRKPDLLMLDEPLSALDHKMRQKLQDYILAVHHEYKMITLLVSHEPGEIAKMSTRVLVLEQGRITAEGTPLDIFSAKNLTGKFQFTGEVLAIEKEDVVWIVSVLIGQQLVKVIAEDRTVNNLSIGDKVLVASKAFNPIIRKIN